MIHDNATALAIGRRESQQDAVSADFALGAGFGFAVLSDGMGGHAAGDVASRIVVTEIFSELKFQGGDPGAFEEDIGGILRAAVTGANDCIAAHAREVPEHRGLGATVVVAVVFSDRLYWISVGDSPLYLFRGGELVRLNEVHSMARQIDAMVRTGQIDAEAARNHPGRNALTSVLAGDRIAKIDLRDAPFALAPGDVVIAASDGIETLGTSALADMLAALGDRSAADVASALLQAVEEAGAPDQDNLSIAVVRLVDGGTAAGRAPARR